MKNAALTNDKITMRSIFTSTPKPAVNYQKFENGQTALHIAVTMNSTECIAILIENGALLLPDANNKTPLHIAAEKQSLPSLKKLVTCSGISLAINKKDNFWKYCLTLMVFKLLWRKL